MASREFDLQGGSAYLEKLQDHESEKVFRKVEEIIDEFFVVEDDEIDEEEILEEEE